MPNVIVTPLVYTRGVLMNLGGYLNVARNMSSEYSRQFGNKAQKIGATFQVRKPQRFEGTEQVTYTPEPVKNIFSTITVDKFFQIGLEWNSIEKTLSIDQAQEKYFKPAAIRIAHKINAEAAKFAFFNTSNTVGTPGVTPGAGAATIPELLAIYLGAGDKLIAQGLPENEEMHCIISRKMSSVFVGKVSSLFTPTEMIGRQLETGWKDPTGLGYQWYKDQGLYLHTSGTLAVGDANTAVDGNGQTGDDGDNGSGSILLKAGGNASTYKKGDWFTIADVYECHPQYRTSTGELKQFKLTEDAVAGADGAVTLNFFPAITPSGQYQNVVGSPADGALVFFDGAAAADENLYAETTSRAGLLLHKNAHAFVSVPLEGPDKGMGATMVQETDPDTGINIRLTRSWDAVESREITRLDCLYGFGWLYRELGCVILSQQ